MIEIYPSPILTAMVMKIWDFNSKSVITLASVKYTSQILAPDQIFTAVQFN